MSRSERTHYEDCWKDHQDCALLQYARSIAVLLQGKPRETRAGVAMGSVESLYLIYKAGKIDKDLFVDALEELLSPDWKAA